MHEHKYSLTEVEHMMPWEREVYISLLVQYIEEENERMKKTALGSSDSVDWEYSDDIIKTIEVLKKKNIKIISIEQADKSLNIEKFIPAKGVKYAFIFGNEVDGISDDIISVSDEVVEIPQVGTKHSLNVSVAAGIVLWDFFYKTEI